MRIEKMLVLILAACLSSIVMATGPGEERFQERCAQCHDADDPATPARAWFERLESMGPIEDLDRAQRAEILDFLRHHERRTTEMVALAEERQLFQERCSLCHSTDRIFLEPLTPEARRHIVFRMQERAPDWISPEEAEKILQFLAQTEPDRPVIPAEEGREPAAVFRERCSACHTLERVYLHLEAGKAEGPAWVHIVQQMRSKAPQWIDEREAVLILEYLEGLKQVH